MITYQNRIHAGRLLAEKLKKYAGQPDLLVLALPRGGVPVAAEVAKSLHAPLDVLVVRKLGAPGYEELAMGAIAAGGVCVLNRHVIENWNVPAGAVDKAIERETRELERRERLYRPARPPLSVRHQTVLLVDDGIATGSTMRAAIGLLKQMHARRVVVTVPVASRESYLELRGLADEFIALATPLDFAAVGQFYGDFGQTSDEEVRALLEENAVAHPAKS